MTALWVPTAGQPPIAAQWATFRPLCVFKLGDNAFVNNSTTFVNDSDLFTSVAANATYEFRADIRYSTNATADLKIGWTFPAGLTMKYSALVIPAAGGALSLFALDQTSPLAVDGTGSVMRLAGLVFVSSTAGTLQFQFAQNTANASNSFTQAGSYISFTQIV